MKTYDSTKVMAIFLSKDEIKAAQILDIRYYPTHIRASWCDPTPLYEFADKDACIMRCRQYVDKVRKNITEKMNSENRIYKKNLTYDEFISETIAKHRKKVAHEAAMLRNEKKIMRDNDLESAYTDIFSYLKTGENIGEYRFAYGKQNRVVCREWADYNNGYARSCKFTMTRRNFILEIKREWHVTIVGRTIVFFRTNLNEGARVEVVKQGRAINDLTTHIAYMVDGFPVIAKSYKEAIKNA